MTKTINSAYNVAERHRASEQISAYSEAYLEEASGNAAFITKALDNIAQAKGIFQVVCGAVLYRKSLYMAISRDRSLFFNTIPKAIGAMDLIVGCRMQ